MDKKKLFIKISITVLLIVTIVVLYVQLRLYFLYKKTTSLADAQATIKKPEYVFDTTDSTDVNDIIGDADKNQHPDSDDIDFSGISTQDLIDELNSDDVIF